MDIVCDICNEVYKTGCFAHDLKHSIFIRLPKKQNAQECSEHRTISLMSHVVKVILKIVLGRNEYKIEGEIRDSQSGFRTGMGTREGIFNLRTILDRYLEVKQDIFICYIDYEKPCVS